MQSVELKFNDKVIAIAELDKKLINNVERPTLKIRMAKAKHPYVNYYYTSENERNQKLEAYHKRLIEIEEEKIKRRGNRKLEVKKFKDSLNVGDVLTCSWGYDQTNVEFFQVISINDKKTKVVIQEMNHENIENEGGSSMSCNVIPGEVYGPKIEKSLLSAGIIMDSSVTLYKWDGKPCYKSWYA